MPRSGLDLTCGYLTDLVRTQQLLSRLPSDRTWWLLAGPRPCRPGRSHAGTPDHGPSTWLDRRALIGKHHAHVMCRMLRCIGTGDIHAEHMARRAPRPRSVIVFYRGLAYQLDLQKCRRALVQRQVDGALDSMEGLAQAVGISRSTASRYFSGRPTSLTVTLKILERLGLKFDDVAGPVDLTNVA